MNWDTWREGASWGVVGKEAMEIDQIVLMLVGFKVTEKTDSRLIVKKDKSPEVTIEKLGSCS